MTRAEVVIWYCLTVILLTWRIWTAPNKASRWHIGFNWAFEDLILHKVCSTITFFNKNKFLRLSTYGYILLSYKKYSLKYIRKYFAFWNAWQFHSIQTVCITAWYIQKDIFIVFTTTFKYLLNFLRTFVYFTMLQEENYFYSKKTFTPRKLSGDDI